MKISEAERGPLLAALFLRLLLIAACFLLLSGGIFGTARFRLPIMPVMILLGGYALAARPVGYTERA